MKTWELMQKHQDEVTKVLQDTGCMDSQGRIRVWRGKKTLADLEAVGHSSVTFDKCICNPNNMRCLVWE
jgi:hypothetical protein